VREAAVRTPEPIKPKPAPEVVVGLFQQNAAAASNREPARETRVAGFDAIDARRVDRSLPAANVGTFDQTSASGASPRRGDRTTSAVATAGFAVVAAAPPQARAAQGVVRDTGFDVAPAAQPAAPRRQDPVDVPVEIVFKPIPAYTEEARTLRVEGEVLLEVEFTTSNRIHVIRVIRGLGHGLDECAVQAAEQIRFKPAQSSGRPIDFKTTVHIVFKLA
jgi:TonB family protein